MVADVTGMVVVLAAVEEGTQVGRYADLSGMVVDSEKV